MTDLARLLQLTLYGLKLSDNELASLFVAPLAPWSELLDRIETPAARARLLDRDWCREHWRRLDEWSKAHRLHWTHPAADDFPARLLSLSRPPAILCYRGRPVWSGLECLSVVGSRRPSGDSLEWMRQHLLPAIANLEVTVSSGGARGIDAWAHEITLLAGRPPVCFLPSGILNPYPQDHGRLFDRIVAEGGALVSGFPPDAFMRKDYFHTRNRWIAGIATVTVIVEAQRKSGSLLTARLALDEGRSICTLPVSPNAVQGMGNLDLLYAGAQMIRDQNDLMLFVGQELVAAKMRDCGAL